MSAHVLGRLIDSSGTHDQISHPGLSLRNCTAGPTSGHLLINRCGQMFSDPETHSYDSSICSLSSTPNTLNRTACGTRTECLLCQTKIIRLNLQSDLTGLRWITTLIPIHTIHCSVQLKWTRVAVKHQLLFLFSKNYDYCGRLSINKDLLQAQFLEQYCVIDLVRVFWGYMYGFSVIVNLPGSSPSKALHLQYSGMSPVKH